MSALLVALGAAVGAPLRYLVDRAVQARFGSLFPWGTFVVNVVGSFVLGTVVGAVAVGAAPATVAAGVGVGFCGALTTYSTFSYETLRLVESGAYRLGLLNAAGTLAATLAAAAAGVAMARVVWS